MARILPRAASPTRRAAAAAAAREFRAGAADWIRHGFLAGTYAAPRAVNGAVRQSVRIEDARQRDVSRRAIPAAGPDGLGRCQCAPECGTYGWTVSDAAYRLSTGGRS